MVWNVFKKSVPQAKLIDKKTLNFILMTLLYLVDLILVQFPVTMKPKTQLIEAIFLWLINGESFDERSHILLVGGISETLN